MSESTMQSATELASQYSTQVNDDLERNIKEQERVSTEITALQQQLAALQHDHALLVNMQQALGITSPPPSPTAPEPGAETATVPAPRGGTAAQSAKGGRTRSKRATTAPKRAAAPKPGAKKATRSTATTAAKSAAEAPAKTTTKLVAKPTAKQAPKAAGKSAAQKAPSRPTLVELVREHLAGQREPRSAAEVTAALGEAHSGRAVKTTVVRTTLEGLVAKNQAQRTKQGTSVYYSATEAPAPARQQDSAAESASAQSGS
ncbi:hypothetical protein AB0E99_33380 [Streptomyces sp. NPDC030592]|uniref:hypothetical protein n=1 Tax=Streptomyces sp. NPDC030592 TaxID=3155365 RepID=UPI0033C25E87